MHEIVEEVTVNLGKRIATESLSLFELKDGRRDGRTFSVTGPNILEGEQFKVVQFPEDVSPYVVSAKKFPAICVLFGGKKYKTIAEWVEGLSDPVDGSGSEGEV